MNIYFLTLIIILFLTMFFVAYILSFRKTVNAILMKKGITVSKHADHLKDYTSIYLLLLKSDKLEKYERRILWQHIIFTFITLILWCTFVLVLLCADW